MLREELEFHIRMRNCLRGIQHLDPETIPDRLIELDAEIEALRMRVGAEEPAAQGQAEPRDRTIRAA